MTTITDPGLVDGAARAAVGTDLGRTVVVEAGAGSGKTTAIVERIVALVRDGTPITSLVAVTFTEAAAADLRARLRARLEELVATSGGEEDRDQEESRARAALAGLDDAMIGTVHAWARHIVAEHPTVVGVPPGFTVLDDVQTSIARGRSWRALLDDLLSDQGLAPSVAALDAVRYRPLRLREVHDVLCDHVDRLDDRARRDHGAAPEGEPRPVVVEIDAVLAALDAAVAHAATCTDPADKLLAHLHGLADLARRLRAAPDDLDCLELLDRARLGAGNLGRAASWPDKAAVTTALVELEAAVERTRRTAVDAAVANVVDRVATHVRREARRRRREGELQFADLLTLARTLLRTSPDLRRRLQQRIRVVIIDELQDTDPIQIELAALVATDAEDVGAAAWWELPIPGGALVVVGDPKQSIYRFRRADLRVFRRVLDVHAAGHVSFTTNFRSRPEILRWVDACIGPQLGAGAEAAPEVQADARPLEARRAPAPDGPPVLLLGREHDIPLTEVREREAAEIAALLADVAAGRFRVETSDGGTRRARLGDVAVLLPTRITLPYLEHALARADIPARIESETLVLATDAVRELLVLLEALADPTDAVATVAALRTPTLACSDDDLARHALAGGRWSYLAADLTDDTPADVRRGLEWLREQHARVLLATVDGAVEHVIRAGRLLELGLAHRRPRDHWRRVLHVADLARAFTEAGGTTLRELVTWLRDRADHELRTVEVPVPEPDDDAVRILTVHGAKGLEFPITILAGLNVLDRTGGAPLLWCDDGEPVLTGRPVRRADHEDLLEAERVADRAEAVRLLYVAATRARDHLVVSVHRTSGACAAQRLAAASAECPELWAAWEPPRDTTTTGAPARTVATARAARSETVLATWRDRWATAVACGATPGAVAATALATVEGGLRPQTGSRAASQAESHAESHTEASPRRRGRAGTAIGRAVHATLQTADLAGGDGLGPIARAQARSEGIDDLGDEVAARAASALRAPAVRAAVAGGRWWREVPVGAAVDGTVLEGFVDLLVETPSGLVVVDYKTDHLEGPDDAEAHVARYRIQGAAYAVALEEALDRPVARCVFVFTRLPEPVEHEIDDLPAAMAEARARLAALVGRPATTPGHDTRR